MEIFCKRCGSPIDENGICSVCGKRARKKPEKEVAPKKKKGTDFYLILSAVILTVFLVVSAVLGALVYFDVLDIDFIDDIFVSMGMKNPDVNVTVSEEPTAEPEVEVTEEPDKGIDTSIPYEVTPPDADAYFQSISTVVSEFGAGTSQEVHSEGEAYQNFMDRGFTEQPITTSYSMIGEYYEEEEISSYSSEQHPVYETYYVSTRGEVWSIAEINGALVAMPLSYNEQSSLAVPVMISESSTITSYDSTKNKFYVIEPNASTVIIKTVNRIDAQTLENLTFGAIDAL